jgi:hypothetical protein
MAAFVHSSRCRTQLFLTCAALSLLISLPNLLAAQTAVPADPAAKPDSTALPEAPQPSDLIAAQPQPNAFDLTAMQQNAAPPAGSSSQGSGLSLGDLGITPEQTRGNEEQQERLDRHTHMLKLHQRWGLLTTIPVAAACISSIGAPPEHGNYGNTTSRDVHVGIGGLAVVMYAITASYAIRAPKVSDEPARGGIKLHKYLIYIHAPGMILTPILGAMAFNQINSGQQVHGIASAHSAVAVATAISYGAAILAVSWPIHVPHMHHHQR